MVWRNRGHHTNIGPYPMLLESTGNWWWGPVAYTQKNERKKDDSDVATGMNDGVASFSSWSISIRNPEKHLMRIKGAVETTSTSIWRWIPWTNLSLTYTHILYIWTNCIMVLVLSIWTSKRPTWASRCCIEVFWVTAFFYFYVKLSRKQPRLLKSTSLLTSVFILNKLTLLNQPH